MCMVVAAVPAERGMALDGTGCAEETECAAGMAWLREAPLSMVGETLERNGGLVQQCDVQQIPGRDCIPLIYVLA